MMDEEEYEVTTRAIQKAVEEFYRTIEREELDGAYWQIELKVSLLSVDFKNVLETLTYSNAQRGVEE